jgi:hypothetical protein
VAVLLLDTNCLIDLDEEREPRANDLRRIVEAFRCGRLELVAAAISASENAPPGSKKAFELFTDRLDRIGLAHLRVLHPMGYWGVTFWNEALWVNDEMEKLEAKIHAVLAPNLRMDDDSNYRKWINTKCDVQMVWCHLWHKTDALVTSDGDILSKVEALAPLKATVKSPAAVVGEL